MKNWFSKLLADTNEEGRNFFAIALIMFGAGILSLPLYVYLAIQDGSWQLYVILGTVIFFLIASGLSAVLSRQNRTTAALTWLLGGLFLIVPIIAAMVVGVGIVLAVTVVVVTILIVRQTLSGRRATKTVLRGVVTAILTVAIDVYVPWERASYPLLSTFIPYIAGAGILGISIYVLRGYRQYSLSTKLIGGFLLMTLIPLGVIFFFNNRSTRQILTDNANTALSASAAAAAQELDAFMNGSLTQVRSTAQSSILAEYLALSPSKRAGSETETVLYKELRAIASRDPIYITSVGLIDTQGTDIADTYGADIGLSKAKRIWFTTPVENGLPYVSPLEFSEATGLYSIYFSAPIRNVEGEIIGVLRMRYNANILQKIIVNSAENENITDSFTVLFDENHIRLAHSARPELITKSVIPFTLDKLAQLQEANRLPKGATVEEYSTNLLELEQRLSDVDNQPIFSAEFSATAGELDQAATVRMKSQPWLVAAAQPINTFLVPAQTQTRASAILVTLIAVVVAFIGSFVAQSLSAPIVRLTAVAEQIAAGDNNVQASIETQDEIGVLAGAFNTMTAKLREFIASLEQRVADRTRNLELAAEVGRSVSQVRALDVMLKDAAELIRSQFELYYVQVYLTDASQTNLLLLSGTGHVGEQLVGRGHRLPLNLSSINGRAATEKKAVVIADTATNATFRPNPLLPNTRSEMAVPLIVGEKVVGVLDLQSEKANALSRELLPAFEALAGQLAIAIQNANLLAETEQARAEVEAQARRLVRANWADYLDAIHKPEETGFVFQQNKVRPLTQEEETQSVEKEKGNSWASPIEVTGEALGNLVVELDEQTFVARGNELVNTVAQQVAQHIEALRLLESAERYRAEAEEASRRLTREGWKTYVENAEESLSYFYDLKEVKPHHGNGQAESAVALPLKVRDEVLGKLAIQGIDADDSRALELVNAVAERLSTHIESLRQQDQTQIALTQSEKLFEASRRLTQAADLQQLVDTTVTAMKIPAINRAILVAFNYDDSGSIANLDVIANWWNGTGHQATSVGTHYPLEMIRAMPLFVSSTPVFFNDAFNDERVDATTMQLVHRLNLRAVAVLPLHTSAGQIGALIVEAEVPHNFTTEETRLFIALAPQIATIVDNQRQFERAQKQAERETMLNVISQKIQSATSVEAVLQIAARELGHALGAPMTVAQLSMKDKS